MTLGAEHSAEALRLRSAMTRHLIERRQISTVALDVPGAIARQLDRWVTGLRPDDCSCLETSRTGLGLRSLEVAEFFQWLQAHNAFLPEADRVRIVASSPGTGADRCVVWKVWPETGVISDDALTFRISIETDQRDRSSARQPGCDAFLYEVMRPAATAGEAVQVLRLIVPGGSRPTPLDRSDGRHPIPASFLFGL